MKKYKQNLRIDNEYIYSYETKVAKLDHINKTINVLGWWSVTTSKHINYVGSELNYKINK